MGFYDFKRGFEEGVKDILCGIPIGIIVTIVYPKILDVLSLSPLSVLAFITWPSILTNKYLRYGSLFPCPVI